MGHDGERVIDSVREVVDADGAQLVSNEIYRSGPDGRAVPATPLRAETLQDLIDAGLDAEAAGFTWWGAKQ